jgi:hypothetical protein
MSTKIDKTAPKIPGASALFAHLLVDEMIDLLERPTIHVLGKRLELPRQHRAVLHLHLRARVEAILAHKLDMPRLVLVLRLLGVLDDLNLLV